MVAAFAQMCKFSGCQVVLPLRQGYVVLALEHADGSASAVQRSGDLGWLYYQGLGAEAAKFAKQRWRMTEVQTAYRLLDALNAGAASINTVPGLCRIVLVDSMTAGRTAYLLVDALNAGAAGIKQC